jgi:hypothetical protein
MRIYGDQAVNSLRDCISGTKFEVGCLIAKMSRKFKAIGAGVVALSLIVVGVVFYNWANAWPALPNSPTPLGELIEKSDLIVRAKVSKVEMPAAPLYGSTNKWIQKAVRLFGPEKREFRTAHFEVFQSVKGSGGERIVVDYPIGLSSSPSPDTDWKTRTVVAFLYKQGGAYYPVAYAYGTRVLRNNEAEQLLRNIGEFLAIEKMGRGERENARAEWYVKLIENPATRWDGAASWMNVSPTPGEALSKLSAELTRRLEAVAFRNEPLAQGDELLLREFAPSQPRKVVERLMRYFRVAGNEEVEQPWRCHGAMELLARVAGMSEAFRQELNKAAYPDFSSVRARRDFIERYLPQIKKRLK